ncbi:MAG TPA: hypothetical protein VFF67_06570 [Thermoplasmata archaeon]|nr:hypothetical protein [Thermoplasmata archaeon]
MGVDPEGLGARLLRGGGTGLLVVGFVVSLYALVEVEVFSQYALVYHFLSWSVRAPTGVAGTTAWPLVPCLATNPTYGYVGNRCLFPNYDEMVLLFGTAMGAGLALRSFASPELAELPRRARAKRALVSSAHAMGIYVAAVLVWSIVVFGALPTWDQSVLWAGSTGGGYPAGIWKLFTNTCLIEDPSYTPEWPACFFPNFYEAMVGTVFVVIITYTLKVKSRPREFTDLE